MDIYTPIPSSKIKVCCLNCKSEITLINFNKHYKSKSCLLGFKFSSTPKKQYDSLNCQFCNKLHKNGNSLQSHERFCKLNPNRELSQFELSDFHDNLRKEGKRNNQYTKAQQLNLPKPLLSEETLQKLSIASSKKVWTEEQKQNHSTIMLKVAKENPDSYSAGNQGRAKTYTIDGIKLKGTWEVKFYSWCKQNNINIQRPNEGFSYIYENKTRTYYPDFFLPDFNKFVEVKGYETERDKCKWFYFPHELCIVKEQEIKQIDNNLFSINFFN